MIQGVGIDIIEIKRIRESIERHGDHFIQKLFTEKEQTYCHMYKDPIPHFAGRFAAKEAIVKAFKVGFGEHISWHDIEIIDGEKGEPIAKLSSSVIKQFDSPIIHISISHSHENAVAMATWCKK